ncbi:poly(U)-specific endoribonuclease-like [Protopterus annectens]|uniref:poly(U)-specific endoribonuclease-like n=1 Tax=Protopterus annectens TaxID=7888 RepID=UPI001CFB47C3|nr:poly(U)-specific endoribonuclease-like [Protopterus annectens]
MWLYVLKDSQKLALKTVNGQVFQGRAGFVQAGSNRAQDCAREPLFKYVNEERLKSIKTYEGEIPDEDDQVLSLQFSWKELVKPIGSSFIGVSPEFEFAVYTVVFLMSNEKVTRAVVRVEEYELELVVYRHGKYIGTSYPVLLSTNNEDLY